MRGKKWRADRQHEIAFGSHTSINVTRKRQIIEVKNNVISRRSLFIDASDIARFTDLAWKLLGRYIRNNTHLKSISLLHSNHLTDDKMALLFGEQLSSSSCSSLALRYSDSIGIDGIRSMVPFLQTSLKLKELDLAVNRSINTECFELLVQTLHYSNISYLCFFNCKNIEDISALATYNLPHLQKLNLSYTRIGNEGCSILSNLLQRESTTLKKLILVGTVGDEEAAIIATSLKHNTQLETLHMGGNALTERGLMVFFKLVILMYHQWKQYVIPTIHYHSAGYLDLMMRQPPE